MDRHVVKNMLIGVIRVEVRPNSDLEMIGRVGKMNFINLLC